MGQIDRQTTEEICALYHCFPIRNKCGVKCYPAAGGNQETADVCEQDESSLPGFNQSQSQMELIRRY